MIGQTLGHYRILEKAGAGGMGVVYRAEDESLERDVALKVLPSGALAGDLVRRRFQKEAMALAKLNHPNIGTVYEFGTQDGVDFIAMEYVAGKTLREKLANGSLPEREVVRLGMQIAAALEEAHSRGLIHRDLKPENISITERGDAKVLDFGLAKLLHAEKEGMTETMTRVDAAVGTLPYMCPEQLRGERVDARSDIYSAGAVLYEMATSQPAFWGSVPSKITDAILHQPPVPPRAINRGISAELERIILKCLEKEPEDRFQSAKELGVDLRRLFAPSSVTAVHRRGISRSISAWAFVKAAGVLLLAAGTVFAIVERRTWSNSRGSMPQIRSLAVLPLTNLSADPHQAYFADGVTEELINELSRIGAIRVISRTSVMQYEGKQPPLSQIARELKVDAVLEGTVQRAGNEVKISISLVDTRSDRNLWGESFQGDLSNVLTLQSQVARAVATKIQVRLTPEESATLSANRPVNPQAYEAYLQGRYLWNKRTPTDLKRAIGSYKEALAIDPTYALAYVGLAECYSLLSVYGEVAPREAMPLAKAAAVRALEIEKNVAEAQAVLADIEWTYDWDAGKAEAGFRQALALSPNYASAHQWYALFLSNHARHDEAIVEIERAQQLDPLSLIIEANAGIDHYYARQYDAATQILTKAVQREPDFWVLHSMLGQVYLAKGQTDLAISEFEKAQAVSPENVRITSMLGLAYARAGRQQEAERLLQDMVGLSSKRYVSPALIAIVHMGLGHTEATFTWLEKAYQERSDWMNLLKTEPLFDPLRNDSRFRALLKNVGLE